MRPGPTDEVLAGTAGWSCRISSWLGAEMLSDDVPIMTGRITADVSSEVPERLSFTVPAATIVDGYRFEWCPRDDWHHPLARYGQQLQVQILVTSAVTGTVWDTTVGRFAIQNWTEADDGSIAVEAAGLLQRVADARIVSATGPLPNGTLVSETRRLVSGTGLSVTFDPALADRTCPQAMEWSDDRLGALYDVADAWPARLRTDPWGMLHLLPPLPEEPEPTAALVDGVRGVVVSAPRADTRDRIYNRVVARSADADDPEAAPIQAIANVTTGPMSTSGPYGIVTRFYASPLITTQAQAKASAETILATSVVPSRSVPVELAPDPRIDIDDPVQVRLGDAEWSGYVTSYDLPLTVPDGAMTLTIGIGRIDDEEEGG